MFLLTLVFLRFFLSADESLIVSSTPPGSEAHRLGVQPHWRLLLVDGRRVNTRAEVLSVIKKRRDATGEDAKDRITLQFYRECCPSEYELAQGATLLKIDPPIAPRLVIVLRCFQVHETEEDRALQSELEVSKQRAASAAGLNGGGVIDGADDDVRTVVAPSITAMLRTALAATRLRRKAVKHRVVHDVFMLESALRVMYAERKAQHGSGTSGVVDGVELTQWTLVRGLEPDLAHAIKRCTAMVSCIVSHRFFCRAAGC